MGLSEEEKKLRGEMTKHELKLHMVKLREERERKKQDKLRVKEEKERKKQEKLRVKEEKERKKQEKIDKKKKLVEVESSPVNSDTEEVGGSVNENVDREEVVGSVNENVELSNSENEESDTEIEVIMEVDMDNNEGSYYTFEQYQEAQIV